MAKPTQRQIEAAAALWKDAVDNHRAARDDNRHETAEYFAGKRFSVSETFADLFGMSWMNADDLLSKRVPA